MLVEPFRSCIVENYSSAVLVIAIYGHTGLCYMTGKTQPIMANPCWPSRSHNGLGDPKSQGLEHKPILIS